MERLEYGNFAHRHRTEFVLLKLLGTVCGPVQFVSFEKARGFAQPGSSHSRPRQDSDWSDIAANRGVITVKASVSVVGKPIVVIPMVS